MQREVNGIHGAASLNHGRATNSTGVEYRMTIFHLSNVASIFYT